MDRAGVSVGAVELWLALERVTVARRHASPAATTDDKFTPAILPPFRRSTALFLLLFRVRR
jgi:hypothetical protein